ncbi:MAG: hypothetical protein J3Q66DRAFT_347603 [Benniella sp.]|nr:MAG: hypothetical protein J3Q66DRAFT_347603 [Benniella sp.]
MSTEVTPKHSTSTVTHPTTTTTTTATTTTTNPAPSTTIQIDHDDNPHKNTPATVAAPTMNMTEATPSIPTTTTGSPTLRQRTKRILDRISSFLSFRKLLRNTRLLILALAFATLILDAITISFEVNVMDLGLSDVSTQAALLLTPDLLAIFMSLALLIYSIEASCCCFDGPLDYVDDDDDEDGHYHSQHHQDEEDEEEEGKAGDQHHDASSSDLNGLDDHTREGKSRRHMHDQARRGKDVAARQDLGGSIHDRQQGTQRHYNGTVIPTIAITSASSTLEESPETPSRRVSTIGTDNHPSTHPSPPPTEEEEAAAAAAVVEAEAGITEKRKWKSTKGAWRQRKRTLNLYILTRVLFSLGLVTLALYWPAGQMKPPMGHLPDIPNTGERFRDYGGNGMLTDTGRGSSRIGPPSSPPPFLNNNYPSKHGGHPREGDDDGLSDDGIPDGPNRWCAWETEFGDNQSAVVYCRVNDIRPAITYIWATLIVVELCIAAMAGDFSDTGLYGYRANMGVDEDQDGDVTDSGTGVQEQGYPDGSPDEEMAMGVGVGRVYPAQNPVNTSSHS